MSNNFCGVRKNFNFCSKNRAATSSRKLFCTWCIKSTSTPTYTTLIYINKHRRIWWFLHYEEVRNEQRISFSKTPFEIHRGWAIEIPWLLLNHPNFHSKCLMLLFNGIMSEYVREFTTEMTNVVKQSSVHFSPLNLLLGKHHQKNITYHSTPVKNYKKEDSRKKETRIL